MSRLLTSAGYANRKWVKVVYFYMVYWKRGRVRLIAPVLKTDDPKGSVSSNLTVSASHLGQHCGKRR